MKRCPECGTEYPDGAGYCPLDGVLLVEKDVPAKREGWRMVMPPLVRREESTAGAAEDAGDASPDDGGDRPSVSTTPAEASPSTENPVESSPAETASERSTSTGVDDPRARAGPRRRAGRQMSLGAFAPVPREQASKAKNTIVAYSAPQARVGSPVVPQEVSRASGDGLVGRVLDRRYRIDAKIGEGGMGLVYRATHVIIDKPLAIKVLRTDLAAQHQVLQRFLQEAQLASQIKHPNVVEVSDYGQIGVGSAAYYVMERLSGRTLAQTIADDGRVSPSRALALAVQIARGLGAAHAQSIVHRDLKPDNVFLCIGPEGQEQAKILDFGIARALDKTTRLTAQGVLVGTPAYMAPEQARSSDVDARADLYSLGVMLFECLAGRGPFPERGTMETINQHLFEEPPSLHSVCPELPEMPTVERVLAHLLAKDRNDRPGDANKVIELLEEARSTDLGEAAVVPRAPERRVDTAALGSGSVQANTTEPAPSEDSVDDEALTRVRGDRVAVAEGIELRGRDDADVIQPRTVSPSGRIQKRPSVIIKRGTPIERFVPPPPQPVKQPTARSEYSSDDLRRPPEAGRGPPLGLIIGVAAVVAMALTVTVWKYWLKEPAPTTAKRTAPAVTVDDYVRLRFESSPSGAQVLHSGESLIGQTPIDFQVPRGDDGIVFIFRLPGHVDVAKTVLPDQTKTVRADLGPIPLGVAKTSASPDAPPEESASVGGPAGEELSELPEVTPLKPKVTRPKESKGGKGGKEAKVDKGTGAKTSAGNESAEGEAPEPPKDPPKQPAPASDLGDLKNPFAS